VSSPVEFEDEVVLEEEGSKGERESATEAVVDATGIPVEVAVMPEGAGVTVEEAATEVVAASADEDVPTSSAPARSR